MKKFSTVDYLLFLFFVLLLFVAVDSTCFFLIETNKLLEKLSKMLVNCENHDENLLVDVDLKTPSSSLCFVISNVCLRSER